MTAFEMTVEVAEEYFRRKLALGAKTEEQCFHILLQMVQEGLIKSVEETPETKAEYIERMAQTNRILHLKEKQDESETKSDTDGGEARTLGN